MIGINLAFPIENDENPMIVDLALNILMIMALDNLLEGVKASSLIDRYDRFITF